MANRPDREVELHRLELRFAATRVDDRRAVQRLVQSIDACGQLIACIAVQVQPVACAEAGATPLVLIDGYRRVAALRKLGRDTALLECWSCTVAEALLQVLARSRSRAFTAVEEALLLRDLVDAQRLSQREAARQCGRDVSWVQRRLQLLGEVPEAVLQAVCREQISTWSAVRVFLMSGGGSVPVSAEGQVVIELLDDQLRHGRNTSTRGQTKAAIQRTHRVKRRQGQPYPNHSSNQPLGAADALGGHGFRKQPVQPSPKSQLPARQQARSCCAQGRRLHSKGHRAPGNDVTLLNSPCQTPGAQESSLLDEQGA